MKLKSFLALLAHYAAAALAICALLMLFGAQALAARVAQNPSFVRVLHASPYVGTADVFVDGTKLLSSFAFGSITDYAAIPAGPHKVQIALVGKGTGAAAITQSLAVNPGIAYTVAAIGATAESLSLEVFTDNNQLASGTAKVRVYQLSPDLGSVNMVNENKALVSGIPYQQASDYLAVSAGSYTFNVNAPTANTTLPITATLKENTVTSIFVVGMFNGTPKAELVRAQANGLPGMPSTGSDPTPLAGNSQPLIPWLLGTLALALIGVGVIARRIARLR